MSIATSLLSAIRRGLVAKRALRELGLRQVSSYAIYQASLRLGWTARIVAREMDKAATLAPKSPNSDLLILPDKAELRNTLNQEAFQNLFIEADEVCSGKFHLFGGPATPAQYSPPGELSNWVSYAGLARLEEVGDIKLAWEPGRFGWAVVLARAYYLSQDERYSKTFWNLTEKFFSANPAGYGPHWVSAQEVAIRMICLVFAWQIFAGQPQSTSERAENLSRWIAIHAARIPPTMIYARAQNNNHLLSEAAGLYTAGITLPEHPQADLWRKSGWEWLNQALMEQIDSDGTYVQHSVNYHRMMLQIALWCNALAKRHGDTFDQKVLTRLAAATDWLDSLCDAQTGYLPNMGANDGAYILPLSTCSFSDYRPVIQAAGLSFNNTTIYEAGSWDEMSFWFGKDSSAREIKPYQSKQRFSSYPTILRSLEDNSWAYLRAAHFNNRPGHADQLHFDLWWRGLNLAMDAGTYSYNAAPPWDNPLAAAFVHNTVTLNNLDQMERIGRFLYLQRAQAEITQRLSNDHWQSLTARHNGYRRLNAIHVRTVEHVPNQWLVSDQIISNFRKKNQVCSARLQWLLPDFPWDLKIDQEKVHFTLNTPIGSIFLLITAKANPNQSITPLLVRAGEHLAGEGKSLPTWGWSSPTYNTKQPALSLSVTIQGTMPIEFKSKWDLSGK